MSSTSALSIRAAHPVTLKLVRALHGRTYAQPGARHPGHSRSSVAPPPPVSSASMIGGARPREDTHACAVHMLEADCFVHGVTPLVLDDASGVTRLMGEVMSEPRDRSDALAWRRSCCARKASGSSVPRQKYATWRCLGRSQCSVCAATGSSSWEEPFAFVQFTVAFTERAAVFRGSQHCKPTEAS